MADKIQLEEGLELWEVKPSELREQDLNARSMTNTMFERLTETIERDKRLESFPFCAVTDEGIEIISGHHRVRAATSAGLEAIYVIVDTTGLTKSQLKAKQLAHNSISGIDDASILSQIYKQIDSVEDMREAFVDEDVLEGLTGVKVDEVKTDIEKKSIYLCFLPTWYERWVELIEETISSVDEIAIADMRFYDKFHDAVKTIGKAYDIRSINPLICKFIELADGLQTDGEWVNIVDIFGARVPKSVAVLLRDMVKKAITTGDINEQNKWQILEYLAADYMAK